MIQQMGINAYLAAKKKEYDFGGDFYRSIKSMLRHKYSKEDICYDFQRSLSMIKDYAQYL